MSNSSPQESYFLSYSRADQEFALRFAGDLRANDVAIWVDQLDIRPSEHWDKAIERAVRDCRGLLVILSPRSAASDNVADEISFAIDHKKSVLPLMIEQCRLPLRLTRMQVIDATSDYSRALQLCIDAMSGEALSPRRDEFHDVPNGVQDRETIEEAKRALTSILGPVASVVVDREAMRSRSVADLHARLADHIPDKNERERFRSGALRTGGKFEDRPTPSISPIAVSEVDRLGSVLTHYLGPIATVVARRESSLAHSPDDLKERLAVKIPDERERADFLNRVERG